jgi:hypothetical protein
VSIFISPVQFVQKICSDRVSDAAGLDRVSAREEDFVVRSPSPDLWASHLLFLLMFDPWEGGGITHFLPRVRSSFLFSKGKHPHRADLAIFGPSPSYD